MSAAAPVDERTRPSVASTPAQRAAAAKARRRRRRLFVTLIQFAIVATALLAWEYLPKIGNLSEKSHLLDPFFISSPSLVAQSLWNLMTGAHGTQPIWPFLWPTLAASLSGAAAGMILGAFAGLVCSNFELIDQVSRPFLVALNAVPRIALIPILVILFGITFTTSFASAILIVFFVVFFNAYEGGRSVAPQLMQNAVLLGASPWQAMRSVRAPYVLAWTFASLPLALTFSLLAVVTAEVLTGYAGIGQVLSTSISTSQPSTTFAVIVLLSVMGLVIVGAAELVKRRVLHWWGAS